MNLSKEHKLAFKIAVLLLFFSVFVSYAVPYFNYSDLGKGTGIGGGFGEGISLRGAHRYYTFIILSILIYFVSYFLAKFTIKPIEQQNKKLLEYNHNIAHELKTPISVVKTNLELLELGFDKNLVKSSKQELTFMSEIIDSLLFLSTKDELVDSKEIDLVSLFKENTSRCNKKVNLDIIPKKITVKANEQLMISLIRNLLENASKYGKSKTPIDIELGKKYFIVKNKLEKGFDEKNLEKLFDTFYQSDNSRNTTGYGLGLSIVKKICEIHGFNIKLSMIGDNFTVKVSF